MLNVKGKQNWKKNDREVLYAKIEFTLFYLFWRRACRTHDDDEM